MKILSALKQLVNPAPMPTDSHPIRCESLVVEDNPDEMEFICGLLRFQNVIVTRAYSIAGALEAIGGPTRFQLAFIDLNLKDGSGIEVVRRIRGSKRGTHPVVVSGDTDKIALCLEGGYTGCLLKPYTVDSIRQVLRAHRLQTND